MPAPRALIFLVYWPLTKQDCERYGFSTLERRGVPVRVFDLSGLLHKTPPRFGSDLVSADYCRRFTSYAELDAAVAEAAPGAAFLDCLVNLGDLDLKFERVFRILKRHDARYFIVAYGQLPAHASEGGPAAARWERFVGRFSKLSSASLGRTVNFFAARLLRQLRKRTSLYALPYRIFGSRGDRVVDFMRRYGLPDDRLVPAHSVDYEHYLDYRRRHPQTPPVEKWCVFLDQAVTHHVDFEVLGLHALEAEEYFGSMNALFDKIEKETGLEVVVAAHPRSDYDRIPGAFGKRRVVKEKTVELVQRSSLVVMHDSTAVGYAVLFNKPVMIVKAAGMLAPEFKGHWLLEPVAEALGVEPITVRNDGSVETMEIPYPTAPPPRCEEFRYKYVQARGAADVSAWELVADELARS